MGQRKPHWVSWSAMTQPKRCGGLGFRDLELFNIELFARQVWRILTIHDSLCAKLLKAIYFPVGDILNASLRTHPSQVWRSLLEGKDALSLGLVRRIGDGNSTKIWTQNWIPRNHVMRPIVCLGQNPPSMVAELIDTTTVTWHTDLLHKFFLPIDAAAIQNIPLCTMPMSDFWASQFEKRGFFSVRSAYQMLWETKKRGENLLGSRATALDQSYDERGWTSLWNTKVPSKIRTFLWRLADNLCQQKMSGIIDI